MGMISQKGDVKLFIGLIVVIVIGFGLIYLAGFLVYGVGYRIGQQEVLDEVEALSCIRSVYFIEREEKLEVTFEVPKSNAAKEKKFTVIIENFEIKKDEKVEKLDKFLEKEKEEKENKILIFMIPYRKGQKFQFKGDYRHYQYNPPYDRII